MKLIFILLLFATFSGKSLEALEVGSHLPPCKNNLEILTIKPNTPPACIEAMEESKFLLIDFMSIYCIVCLKSLPIVNQLGIDFLTSLKTKIIAIDRNKEEVISYWQENPEKFPHYLYLDFERTSVLPYKIKSTPTTLLIDPQGFVRYRHTGLLGPDEVEEIKTILRE